METYQIAVKTCNRRVLTCLRRVSDETFESCLTRTWGENRLNTGFEFNLGFEKVRLQVRGSSEETGRDETVVRGGYEGMD